MSLQVTILGCGSSTGVPMVGCQCPVCQSDNPKNRRLRASIWVRNCDTSVLIDSSPDLRQQALANGMQHIDAVIYTHEHADHLHGIDDLRSYNFALDGPLPIYADDATLAEIHSRFPYVFLPRPQPVWYRPCLQPNRIETAPPTVFQAGSMGIQPLLQTHGGSQTLGFRIGAFAYSTDVNELPPASLAALRGVDTWVVDCLRYDASPSHADLAQTLAWIEEVQPRRAILTHMAHQMEYETLKKQLPAHIEPAYDGMCLTIPD